MGNPIEDRTRAAKLLVHGLAGDSWGIQEVLIEAGVSLTESWPLAWETGNLLRTYLPDDLQAQLAGRLRQEILNQELSNGEAES